MQVEFINDKFDNTTQLWYEAEGVKLPKLGEKYTIREIRVARGTFLLLLNEIKNDLIESSGKKLEPAFPYFRFTDIPDNVLEWETVRDMYNKQEERKGL